MTESEAKFNPENSQEITGWREAVKLPVVTQEKPWDLNGLEVRIRSSVIKVTEQALKDNNGEIFTTLSGGVDSTLCLAIISELCPPETIIHTVTVGGSENNPDVQFARVAAKMFNTDHHEVIIGEQEKEGILAEFLKTVPDPKTATERNDVNVWIAYKELARLGAKSVIAHDMIDELLGGYWPHCATSDNKQEQVEVFKEFWGKLEEGHLQPLEATASYFGIKLLLPYSQKELVEYASAIPVGERASFKLDKDGWKVKESKIPLKAIADKYLVGDLESIVHRQKRGFVDALKKE